MAAAKKPTPGKGKTQRGTLQLLCAMMLCIVGAGLLVLGFYAPPQGEIHSSVLVAYGETLTFAGACFGIDYYHRFKPK